MKYDLNLLNQYVDKGWVVKQDHPTLPLSIYNYSRGVQYEKLWDPITLNCRGLVLDTDGNIVAKAFPKFFNYEELTENSIPKQPFEVFEKMDGSLGIFFHYNDEWHMATRGSFTSEQAIKGMEIAKMEELYKKCVPGFTYLFEIIYPENRIVVDYGTDERLVLLSIINPEGNEIPYEEIEMDGWDIVNRYDGIEDFKTLKNMIPPDEEGYVIRFKGGMRMKIKGDEYVRLHRILTNFSTTDIWELLRTKGNMNEFLDRVPDEFDNWVKSQIDLLTNQFHRLVGYASREMYKKWNRTPAESKKQFAEWVMAREEPSIAPIMFALYDNKPYEHIVWKMIKPKWSKPFRKDIDK